MRGRRQVDSLTRQYLHPIVRGSDSLELRQVRMKVQGLHITKQTQLIQRAIDLGWRGRAVGASCRSQSVAVLNRHAQCGEQRARESAEALARRNGVIPVVAIFGELVIDTLLP